MTSGQTLFRAVPQPTSARTSATIPRVSCSTSLTICSIAGVPALNEANPRPTGRVLWSVNNAHYLDLRVAAARVSESELQCRP